MELRHGTDKAKSVELLRNGQKVDVVVQKPGCKYFPAMPGDILRSTWPTEKWEHVVTEEDVKKGYVIHSIYSRGYYNSTQISLVFVVPRKSFINGAADRPCISVW